MVENWRDSIVKNTWQHRRIYQPQEIYRDNAFTDLTVVCDRDNSKEYRVHKLIMATHSDYFYRILTSGMKEEEESRIKFCDISAKTFEVILTYIYGGRLGLSGISDDDDTLLRDVLLASNMLQMDDLEYEALLELSNRLSPQNCIQTKIVVDRVVVQSPSASGSAKDEVVNVISDYLSDCLRDRWNEVIKSDGFLELDLESLIVILEHRAGTEEISDFTFSFIQGDLVNGILYWLNHKLDDRFQYLNSRLNTFFCLHQIRSDAKKAIVSLIEKAEGTTKTDLICRGRLCPLQVLNGLLIVHAWTPHENNFITSDHVKYSFVNHLGDVEGGGPLEAGSLYRLKEFGELCEGEKHLIVPNNSMTIQKNLSMIMTAADDKLSGLVVDALKNRTDCPNHHSIIYHFCPTNFPECKCSESHWSFCHDADKSEIIAVSCCPAVAQEYEYDPCCRTFQRLKAPDTASGAMSVIDNGDGSVLWFGGHKGETGNRTSVVMPTQDLLDRGGYKGGHSIVSTVVQAYKSSLKSNKTIWQYCSDSWTEIGQVPDEVARGLHDAASISVNGLFYVVGGCTLEVDHNRELNFFQPTRTTWILDRDLMTWRQGPRLPESDLDGDKGFARGTLHRAHGGLIYSGGVRLRVNPTSFNQIYQYVTNTKVFFLSLDDHKSVNCHEWVEVLDLDDMKNLYPDYCVYGVMPSELSMTRIKIHRGQFLIDN